MELTDGLSFSLRLWLSVFRGSVSSMEFALLGTHQRDYLWASWCTLRQEISDFLEIASADEELLYCASVSAELKWYHAETEFRATVDAEPTTARCYPTSAPYRRL